MIAILGLVACGSQLEQDVQALVSAKNTWIAATDSKVYSFTVKQDRHHSIYNNVPIRIRVENQEIVSAKIISNGEAIRHTDHLPTIKSIFMGIFEFIKACEHFKACEDTYLELEYHEDLGYPTHVKQYFTTRMMPYIELFVFDVEIEE